MSDYDAQLNAFLHKTGMTREDYDTEFAEEAKRYTSRNLEIPTMVIFRAIKGRYSTSMKSNAPWYQGYFIGVDKITDWAKKTYDDDFAPMIESYKTMFGEKWIEEAMKAGDVNKDGKPIHNATTTNQKWMYGKVIPSSEPKRKMYAFLEDENGNRNFTVVYTTNVNGFLPVPGQIYKFRAGAHKDTVIWTINTTSVSKLIPNGGCVTYDQAQEDIEQYLSPTMKTYEELYDVTGQQVIVDPMMPKEVNFACNMVMVASYNVVSDEKSSVDYVELTDLVGDWDDNLPVVMEHGLTFNMATSSQGIAIWTPFFKKNKNANDGSKIPAGQLLGFIVNEQITPLPDVEINTTELKSENDFD